MRKSHRLRVYPRGILKRLLERLRGREQLLVRAGDDVPLLLLSFPRGRLAVAREIEAAYARTLPRLSSGTRAPYQGVFALLPTLIVVLLRPRNPCGCLGHHHPRGAETRLTRRLAAELGSSVGEIDLAYEGIRQWEPRPLASMAAGELGGRLPDIHFQAAVLAVMLHEFEHLAVPESAEPDTRARSDWFYSRAMQELVAEESGAAYGMASPRPPRP
jgi:hypothetical protein